MPKQPGKNQEEESDCCPSRWSSFLLPRLTESSGIWTSAKRQRAFLAKRSNCGHYGPKPEGSVLWGGGRGAALVSAGCNLILGCTCSILGRPVWCRDNPAPTNSNIREASLILLIHLLNLLLLWLYNLVIKNIAWSSLWCAHLQSYPAGGWEKRPPNCRHLGSYSQTLSEHKTETKIVLKRETVSLMHLRTPLTIWRCSKH